MNKSTIAANLLAFLASGGTIERAVAELPRFKTQIESVLDWMRSSGRCSDAEILERALRLREAIQRKDQAIRRQDFDLAAKMRAEEHRLFGLFWLETPRGTSGATLDVGIDEQIRHLGVLLNDTSAA